MQPSYIHHSYTVQLLWDMGMNLIIVGHQATNRAGGPQSIANTLRGTQRYTVHTPEVQRFIFAPLNGLGPPERYRVL